MTTIHAFLLALLASVFAPIAFGEDSNSTCASITDIVCAEDNLNAVCEAISISGLDDDLAEETWTVFVPTDEAFEELGRDNLDYLVFGNDTVPLTDLLLFHVVPGVALTSDLLPCVAGENLIEMANGDDSRTKCRRGIPVFQKGKFNTQEDSPQFIETDIMACNGVIHILDKVMLYESLPHPIPVADAEEEPVADAEEEPEEEPVADAEAEPEQEPEEAIEEAVEKCQTIVELACSNPRFTTVCALVNEFGLADDLSDGMWTVFAPSNQAFDNAPPFPADVDLNFVLQGHVVANEAIRAEDLVCTEKIEMLNGKLTRTVCKNGTTYQNGVDNDDDNRPEIVLADIEACNGIIHAVSQVILS